MAIFKGLGKKKLFYIGNSNVKKIYLGGNLVFPYDAEIEYLEGTGVQYIDTNIIPNINMKAIISASGLKEGSEFLFGSRIALYDSMFAMVAPADTAKGNIRYDYCKKIEYSTTDLNERHIYELNGSSKEGLLDGNKVVTLSEDTYNFIHTIHLFGLNNNGVHKDMVSTMKLYSFSLFLGDVIIMNLIPVRVGQVGYMYDKVSDQLFGNAGTGDFVLGNDV